MIPDLSYFKAEKTLLYLHRNSWHCQFNRQPKVQSSQKERTLSYRLTRLKRKYSQNLQGYNWFCQIYLFIRFGRLCCICIETADIVGDMPVSLIDIDAWIISLHCDCVTQLKLYTLDKLSSTIFCCLWVSVWGIGNTRPNLHFFNIYRH